MRGCTLLDLVSVLGPPDKVHNLIYYAADGQANVGVEFIYPSRGVNFKAYDVYYDVRATPLPSLTIDEYACYSPTTLEVYLREVQDDRTSQNRMSDYYDWPGFSR